MPNPFRNFNLQSPLQLLGNDYGNMEDREDSNDNTFGPGDMDGRATMVPPTNISTLRVSTKKDCKT